MSSLQNLALTAAVVAVGTAYVLIHEHRRKLKAERKKAAGADGVKGQRNGQAAGVMTRTELITILEESASAAFQLIEQTRRLVFQKHEQTGVSLEEAVDELQQGFESAMETVVTAIRRKHNVTEQQMTQAMVAHQADQEVQTAVTTLREAMSGKAPAKPTVTQESAKPKPTRRAKPRQKKG